MCRGLSCRHLTGRPSADHVLQDTLKGHIARSDETGVVLVVAGKAVSTENLATILGGHEGWTFELTVIDALDGGIVGPLLGCDVSHGPAQLRAPGREALTPEPGRCWRRCVAFSPGGQTVGI